MSDARLKYLGKLKISLAKCACVYFFSTLGTLHNPLAPYIHPYRSMRNHVILSSHCVRAPSIVALILESKDGLCDDKKLLWVQ